MATSLPEQAITVARTEDDAVLIKTDSSGTLQWSRTFGGNGNEDGWLLDIANDGGYVTGGWTESFGNLAEHIYLVKTDTSGNAPCNENTSPAVVESIAPFVTTNAATVVMSGPNTTSFTPMVQRAGTVTDLCFSTGIDKINRSNELTIYPNPGSGTVHIISPVIMNELQVTNMLGQIVYEVKPKSTSITLQIDNAGIYYITTGAITDTQKVIIIK